MDSGPGYDSTGITITYGGNGNKDSTVFLTPDTFASYGYEEISEYIIDGVVEKYVNADAVSTRVFVQNFIAGGYVLFTVADSAYTLIKDNNVAVIALSQGTLTASIVTFSQEYMDNTIMVDVVSSNFGYPALEIFNLAGLGSVPAMPSGATADYYFYSTAANSLQIILLDTSEDALIQSIMDFQTASDASWYDMKGASLAFDKQSVTDKVVTNNVYPVKTFQAQYKKAGATYEITFIFCTDDTSLLGLQCKKNTLIIEVVVQEYDIWPTSYVDTVVGISIPVYSGTANSFSTEANFLSESITIDINGTTAADYNAYLSLLESSDYVNVTGIGYVKKIDADKVIVVSVNNKFSGGIRSTQVVISRVATKGYLNAWPAEVLADYCDSVTVPAVVGATSYNCYAFGHSEVIAYGVTEEEYQAYRDLLEDNGYTYSSKAYLKAIDSNYSLKVSLSYNEVFASLTINVEIKMVSPLTYSYPTNLKVVLNELGLTYTFIKIGDDYFVGTIYSRSYFEKQDEGWVRYSSSSSKTGDNQTVWFEWAVAKQSNSNEVYYYTETELARELSTYTRRLTSVGQIDDEFVKTSNITTIAGKSCDAYTSSDGVEVYYVDSTTGLVLRYTYVVNNKDTESYLVTTFDTTVTDFGDIDLPEKE